jgi:hypothetical protein
MMRGGCFLLVAVLLLAGTAGCESDVSTGSGGMPTTFMPGGGSSDAAGISDSGPDAGIDASGTDAGGIPDFGLPDGF